jgi:hypothetical protein
MVAHVAPMGKQKKYETKFQLKIPIGRNNFGEEGIKVKTILKWSMQKCGTDSG